MERPPSLYFRQAAGPLHREVYKQTGRNDEEPKTSEEIETYRERKSDPLCKIPHKTAAITSSETKMKSRNSRILSLRRSLKTLSLI